MGYLFAAAEGLVVPSITADTVSDKSKRWCMA